MLFGIMTSLSLVFAGAVITEFRGEPGFNKVTLKWVTESETNLKGFDIQRALADQEQEFEKNKIAFVEAKGTGFGKTEYVYEDNTVFKSLGRTYYYRLKIVDKNGQSTAYSQVVSVSPTISSTRQTWGSIKAMFR
ncbi:MAG: hypothetical protein ONB42_08235 [candidate division KSB1 bacterium]|nr:hypothetical protein [candidate division KSB1 bacterium]